MKELFLTVGVLLLVILINCLWAKLFKQNTLKWVFYLSIIAFIINLTFIFFSNAISYKSTLDWENGDIARKILNGNGYSSGDDWGLAHDGQSTAHKPPLYPLLLTGIYSFFPDEWEGGYHAKSHLVVQILQSILYSMIIIFIYLLGRILFDNKIAFISSSILTFTTSYLYYVRVVERMTLEILLLTIFVYLSFKLKDFGIRNAFVFGFILSLLILLNGSFIFIIPALIYWIMQNTNKDKLYTIGKWVACLSLTIMICISPWVIRNYLAFNKVIPLTSNFGLELWIGNHELSTGGIEGIDINHPASWVSQDLILQIKDMDEPGKYAFLQEIAINNIKKDPVKAIKMRFLSLLQFWYSDRVYFRDNFINDSLKLIFTRDTLFVTTCWIAIILLVMRGIDKKHLYIMLLMLLFSMPYVITHAGCRYKMALTPLIVIYSAYLLNKIYEYVENKYFKGRIAVRR